MKTVILWLKILFLNFVPKQNVLAEVKVLDVSKAIQENDILVKTIETNDNFFAEGICYYFKKIIRKR